MGSILIVEDSEIDRKIISRVVNQLGYSQIQFVDGLQAWNFLLENETGKGKNIELIITDYMMPSMNGEVFVKSIKNHKEYEKTPLIMVSGIVKLSEIMHLLKLGIDRFMPKPINTAELGEYIEDLIKKDVNQSDSARLSA
jgi:CheY-like chemotaxis protein